MIDFKGLDNTIAILQKVTDLGIIIQIAKQVNRSNEDYLIKQVTDRIYKKGTRFDGKLLRHKKTNTYPYSSPYEKFKRRIGKYQNHVDLSLSGDFLKGFFVEFYDDGFTVKALEIDLRYWLIGMYGNSFEGLTDEQEQEFKEKIFIPQFKKLFKEKIKGL